MATADDKIVSDPRGGLAALRSPLADAFERFCGDVSGVTIHRGSILDVAADAVVSPANSFGFMDGGLDALCRDYFGSEIQRRVQQQIHDQHGASCLSARPLSSRLAIPKFHF